MRFIRKRETAKGCTYQIIVKVQAFNGEMIERSKRWTPPYDYTEKQLELALERVAIEYEQKIIEKEAGRTKPYATKDTYFNVFFDLWLEKRKLEISESYYASMINARNIIFPLTGKYRLCEFTPSVLQDLYGQIDAMEKDVFVVRLKSKEKLYTLIKSKHRYVRGFCDNYGFPYTTLKEVANQHNISMETAERLSECLQVSVDELFDIEHTVEPYKSNYRETIKKAIRLPLSEAVKLRIIEKNYADHLYITYKHSDVNKVHSMTFEEASKLLETLNTMHVVKRAAITTLLLTGIRKGELCGLNWGDIDFTNNIMSINRSYTLVAKIGPVLGDVKTPSANRSFEIPVLLVNILNEYKQWYEEKVEMLVNMQEQSLFVQKNGCRIHPTTIRNWFDEALEKACIKHYSVHSLRHTHITLLLAAGTPVRTVSSRVGHRKSSTTTNIYADFLGSSDIVAAQAIDTYFADVE